MKKRSWLYKRGKLLTYRRIYGGRLKWYDQIVLRLWFRVYGKLYVEGWRRAVLGNVGPFTGRVPANSFIAQSDLAEEMRAREVARILQQHPGAQIIHDDVILP